jgi:hypothetical protein
LTSGEDAEFVEEMFDDVDDEDDGGGGHFPAEKLPIEVGPMEV